MTIDKQYLPHDIEKKWYHFWETNHFFKPKQGDKNYCIMLPPPNVTGTLHMGHAFQDSIMDTLCRYHRMRGYETLWQGGTDHAGIATQMVVEKRLMAQNISKYDLGRDDFVKQVWEWKNHSGDVITKQMRRLATSIDWTRERFTMDDGLSAAVLEVFVRLYDEGLIYRGKRLVNWDPKLQTAVSDLEVISEEEAGHLWHIRYPIENSDEYLVVATTRPETMLGDVAVAIHPADERYSHLKGKNVVLPLANRVIPIIEDDFVDAAFGSGCVKITPAHDFNDYEVGKRHNLPSINILTDNAVLNHEVPEAFRDLPRFVAREKIVEKLSEMNLLEKIEPHKLKVPRGDRTGEIVEPYLTDQWFVKTKPLAEAAIAAVKEERITFVPENWTKTFYDWMENIQDWCISRQLWWGHRIPAWYDENGRVFVGKNIDDVRKKYQLSNDVALCQDQDVLDTWFSSALWPFSTLGWPEQTPELNRFYPTSVLVTGFDIIFFWVARMIMLGLKFMNDVPFRQVFVHGLIQDAEGQKMSKSKGNIIDPIDLIDGIDLEALVLKRTESLMQPKMAKEIERSTRKHFPEGIPSYGTDALRFTFLSLATTGRHIRFDLGRIEGYRNFCNKIWNASRFVFMNLEGHTLGNANERAYTLYDKAIVSAWQQCKKLIEQHTLEYRFDLLSQTIYDFIWNTYCDWYLELAKPNLSQSSPPAIQMGTRYTLITLLEEMLRALHPLMPFITEEIWQKVNAYLTNNNEKPSQSIMTQPYPEYDADKVDENALKDFQLIQSFIMAIRTLRGEMNLHPTMQLPLIVTTSNPEVRTIIENEANIIRSLAKIESISWSAVPNTISATIVLSQLEISVPLSGLIDKTSELTRLQKEMDKLTKEIDGCQRKLSDEKYISKAPQDIIDKEKERLEMAQTKFIKLKQHYEKIQKL
jgi:valyl-tRNA synthetase